MKEKKELKKIFKSPIMLVVIFSVITVVLSLGTTYGAVTYLYDSKDVSYDNTKSGIVATDVQGAVDELYACASDYSGINTRVTTIESQIYPVGSIYISVNNTNPSILFGGTWESFGSGRTLVGVDTNDNDFNAIEKIGGNKSHQHRYGLQYASYYYATVIEGSSYVGLLNYSNETNYTLSGIGVDVGRLTSSFNNALAGGRSGEIAHYKMDANTSAATSLQPYITVYMWKRTA